MKVQDVYVYNILKSQLSVPLGADGLDKKLVTMANLWFKDLGLAAVRYPYQIKATLVYLDVLRPQLNRRQNEVRR